MKNIYGHSQKNQMAIYNCNRHTEFVLTNQGVHWALPLISSKFGTHLTKIPGAQEKTSKYAVQRVRVGETLKITLKLLNDIRTFEGKHLILRRVCYLNVEL